MKYLFTDNATQEYKGKGREYHKFESIKTTTGAWIGVFKCSEQLAKDLLEVNPSDVKEVDQAFYDEIVKKKHENPNMKTIQVSMDPTKPVHAEYKEKAEDAEFVEVEAIEVRDIEEKPKPKSRAKKAKK
jgi:hypothetical protein